MVSFNWITSCCMPESTANSFWPPRPFMTQFNRKKTAKSSENNQPTRATVQLVSMKVASEFLWVSEFVKSATTRWFMLSVYRYRSPTIRYPLVRFTSSTNDLCSYNASKRFNCPTLATLYCENHKMNFINNFVDAFCDRMGLGDFCFHEKLCFLSELRLDSAICNLFLNSILQNS